MINLEVLDPCYHLSVERMYGYRRSMYHIVFELNDAHKC